MANPASGAPRNLDSAKSGTSAQTPSPTQHPTVDLTALTTRDDFLLELGEALGGQASVHLADSIDTALGQLTSTKRGQMLVIDARGTSDVRSDVQRATQQAAHAVVVVFAEADSEKQIASAVKGTRVFAVLTIPIEGPKTTAVLDAAIADAVNRSAAARGTGTERPAAGGSAGAATLDVFRPRMSYSTAKEPEQPEEGGRKWPLWAGLGLAVVALAAGGAWYFTHGRAAPGPNAASVTAGVVASHSGAASQNAAVLPQPAVDTSIVAGRVDDLLEKARSAMRDRRYTAPTGDNALVYYRSALAADPTSGEAKDGLRRVGDVLVSRFTAAMAGAHHGDAALALATLKLAQPSDPHLGSFQLQLSSAEISAALAEGNTERATALLRQAQQSGVVPAAQLAAWRAQLSHLQQADRVQSLAALVLDRIHSDELTSPPGDSAEAYLSQLQAASPSAPATERAANALVAALLDKARQNALAGDSADESRWLAAARANGASAAEVAEFERQLASSQAKAAHAKTDHLLSLVRERLESGALTSPAGDSAANYLQQLEDSQPAGSAAATVARARAQLAAKLIARARSEMSSGEEDQANADLAAATSWGASATAVAGVQRLSSSPQAEAQAAPAGPDLKTLAARLQRTRYVAPQYPDSALDDRISGSVTVQYVVDKKGRTKDLRVIESSPRGVFDRATTQAIRGWRYRPAKYNGQPVEVPVQVLIRFELPK
ncbi:MAG: energy transducer TonB [Steroidobacteraceae bacterium]